MLSKSLYDLCLLISTPYENLNLFSNSTYILDYFILEEIYLKKLFNFKWRKKLNSSYTNFKFDHTYEILQQNSHYIKLKLKLKNCFTVLNSTPNIHSICIDEYIIILEHLNNTFEIQLLIQNEENPNLVNYATSIEFRRRRRRPSSISSGDTGNDIQSCQSAYCKV